MSTVYLNATAIVAPGLNNWPSAVAILSGNTSYVPEPLKLSAPELLPATERRRSSDSVRLALRVAEEALSAEAARELRPAAIFSSAYGDPTVTHKLCELLSETPPAASPTLFHNSVHNAPAGYWSIATSNPSATNSIAAGGYSAASGLIAAVSQCLAERQPVLLICYDLPYPLPLHSACPIDAPFASALLISHEQNGEHPLKLTVDLCNGGEPSQMQDQRLEALRQGNPAARMLPLLQTIANSTGRCRLAYNDQLSLSIEVSACS